jgi:hypothetical protein
MGPKYSPRSLPWFLAGRSAAVSNRYNHRSTRRSVSILPEIEPIRRERREAIDLVPRAMWLEFGVRDSGNMKVSFQAARSNG